ncbi:hypothetical protein [Maridesulfovibrio hydrothermalis]|uniref:Uncharacterized protein n=1 Tax=Maridesulfovibrio hydrothermalis AM13 = DSM 14728 TaxID=1121451 RepID=L0RFU4_9BACT|nr:hypothetical protein [Maridesulfovibrio hydrothermalis]CCO25107.1 conserved protein of unknown function [Maridesulfovibrio hydrothermalis AM13 = DSM 14728]
MTIGSGLLEDEQREAEEIKKEQRRITEQFLSDVRATFGTPHGKRIFTFLLEQGGVNAPLFSKENDIYRNVAVHDFVVENVLASVVMADEEIYLSIIRERAEKLRHEEEIRK